MGCIVQFDWNTFKAAWPALEGIGTTLAQNYWDIATTMHRNDGGGPINKPTLQTQMLNALTAHLAFLFAPKDQNGNPSSSGTYSTGVVGQVTSATEGSVSVGVAALTAFNTAQAQWLAQTQAGSLYFAMTAGIRTFNYRPPINAVPTIPIVFPTVGRG